MNRRERKEKNTAINGIKAKVKSLRAERALDVEKLNRKFINMIIPGSVPLIPDDFTMEDVQKVGGV